MTAAEASSSAAMPTPTPAGSQAPLAVAESSPWQQPTAFHEWFPLCGAPLHTTQDWCLRCGAAARTRLAATPRWRTPLFTFATIVLVSLGVLVASLVKLIG